jgi:hypothetical protein
MNLKFLVLDLATSSFPCGDMVKVYGGVSEDGNLLFNSCDQASGSWSHMYAGTTILVTFQSDGVEVKSGFAFKWVSACFSSF